MNLGAGFAFLHACGRRDPWRRRGLDFLEEIWPRDSAPIMLRRRIDEPISGEPKPKGRTRLQDPATTRAYKNMMNDDVAPLWGNVCGPLRSTQVHAGELAFDSGAAAARPRRVGTRHGRKAAVFQRSGAARITRSPFRYALVWGSCTNNLPRARAAGVVELSSLRPPFSMAALSLLLHGALASSSTATVLDDALTVLPPRGRELGHRCAAPTLTARTMMHRFISRRHDCWHLVCCRLRCDPVPLLLLRRVPSPPFARASPSRTP